MVIMGSNSRDICNLSSWKKQVFLRRLVLMHPNKMEMLNVTLDIFSMRLHLSFPSFLGGVCFNATYLINCTPTKLNDFKTPHEVLFGVKPTLDDLKNFGCLCYAHNHSRSQDKFGERSTNLFFWVIHMPKKGGMSMSLKLEKFLHHEMWYSMQISLLSLNQPHSSTPISLIFFPSIEPF